MLIPFGGHKDLSYDRVSDNNFSGEISLAFVKDTIRESTQPKTRTPTQSHSEATNAPHDSVCH